jgi:hypothetical protein
MGFDAWFFSRLDYQDKNRRENDKELEWVWFPSKDTLGSDINIFTHTLWNNYAAPNGFDFELG